MEKTMKIGMLISVVMWIGILSLCSCAGVEVGGKLGVYSVETRDEQQHTTSKMKPLKCLFTNCAGSETVEGS